MWIPLSEPTVRRAVRPLRSTEVDAVYPLVSICRPQVSLEDWRRFALDRMARGPGGQSRSGVMAAALPDATSLGGSVFCGVFAYRIDTGLEGDRLIVDEVMAPHVVSLPLLSSLLIEASLAEAQTHGCRQVSIAVPWSSDPRSAATALSQACKARGLAAESLRYGKALPGEDDTLPV
jgi:hypothetical protein